ncbi:MAG: hypothetical protein LAO79_10205 [Acidobacteriia bacterium]|nr:hypothetical protein [Terriglobia bacterium]
MKCLTSLPFLICAISWGDDLPAKMTKLMVKLESQEIPRDSFAAQPKRMYRAGSRYCRTEENPDLQNGIHGLMIINEPDVWLINRLDMTAKHMVDPGPTYNCRMPMFVNAEDIRGPEDLKKILMQLEFGRELEFFKPRATAPVRGLCCSGRKRWRT